MALSDLLILAACATLLRASSRGKARSLLLLGASTLAIFWLQPATPIRFLDFWLPVLTLFLTIVSWLLTAEPEQKADKKNWLAAGIVLALVLAIAATRYLGLEELFTASRPPNIGQVLTGLAAFSLLIFLLRRFSRPSQAWLAGGIIFLLLLFLVLKTPGLALWASVGLRSVVEQATASASALDIRWLGFSYVAFRLIHTLRDRQGGKLPGVSLADYVNYIIFFPSFSAGPLDRLPRFVKDLQKPLLFFSPELGQAFYRLTIGIFKKFALADTLSLLALSPHNAAQLQPGAWAWILVYAYAFQIYFDFAGYTDIAIGLGQILGVNLPENFNRPYLKPNLTQFWNNWHMTLTQWFRAYFFNPFTRSLRSRYRSLGAAWIVLITQLSTMLLIGLWHGVTWNFVLWGLWHGLGMFVQNRFTDWMKPRQTAITDRPRLQTALNFFNTVFTFHFVALGWVWFALPDVTLSLGVFARLFGLAG
jgi:D-alanyl-lipoteichoic acid acyltransferase DltB (MBOAT superfamily)